MNTPNENLGEGLWQLDREIDFIDDQGKIKNNAYIFDYHDGTVVLRLLTPKAWEWKSEDDFYRLETKFENNTLYYLPPFGEWSELATFDDGYFFSIGNGKKRIYKKIGDGDVAEWNKSILNKDRALHDYRRLPDGSLR